MTSKQIIAEGKVFMRGYKAGERAAKQKTGASRVVKIGRVMVGAYVGYKAGKALRNWLGR